MEFEIIENLMSECLKNDGIFELNVNSNEFYKRLRSEQSLPKWRVTMIEMFFYGNEGGTMFTTAINASNTKAQRIAKNVIKPKDGDWVLDLKELSGLRSDEEVAAFLDMITRIKNGMPESYKNRILFCNDYDKSKRIYLSVHPQCTGDNGCETFEMPFISEFLNGDLKVWQKKHAKDLRALGRYSMSAINSRGLYGSREVFRMVEKDIKEKNIKPIPH